MEGVRKHKNLIFITGILLIALLILCPPVQKRENTFGHKANDLILKHTIAAASGTFVFAPSERYSSLGSFLKKSFTDKLAVKSTAFVFEYFFNCQSVQPSYRNESALSILVYKCVLRI